MGITISFVMGRIQRRGAKNQRCREKKRQREAETKRLGD
jgi:hypothetical protein